MNNQGIVRCTTTITGLSPVHIYVVVYNDTVLNNYVRVSKNYLHIIMCSLCQ